MSLTFFGKKDGLSRFGLRLKTVETKILSKNTVDLLSAKTGDFMLKNQLQLLTYQGIHVYEFTTQIQIILNRLLSLVVTPRSLIVVQRKRGLRTWLECRFHFL
jgi:hypothetical protein